MFHGQGVGIDGSKDRLLHFFRQVDRGVTDLLKPTMTPLVLAGVEYLHLIYRAASTHPRLLQQGIQGIPEGRGAEALRARRRSQAESRPAHRQHEGSRPRSPRQGGNMAEERTRIELKCANCGRVLGTFPEGEPVDTSLVCPNCGAVVSPPGVVARLAGEVKEVIDRITGKDTKHSGE